jgi:hypothetical protein
MSAPLAEGLNTSRGAGKTAVEQSPEDDLVDELSYAAPA